MRRSGWQRGTVLIVVLWVIALLTLLLGAFVSSVKVERQSAADVVQGVQARAALDAVLNYLAALNGAGVPELEEMPGQRYELFLNEQLIAFRVMPESAYIPFNALEAEALAAVLSIMRVPDAELQGERLIELRHGGIDEVTGESWLPVTVRSMAHLAQLLGVDMELLVPYERWFSFVGQHQQVVPGVLPQEFLGALQVQEATEELFDPWLWNAAVLYRVQVEVSGIGRPRRIEAIVSFSGAQYGIQQLNEYNVDFSLNSLSE